MLMYDAHFLDAATRDSIRGQFLSAVAGQVDGAGELRVSIGWLLILAAA